MIHDLKSRLKDLKHKKDAILARSQYIKSINEELLTKVSETQKVEQKDPLFNQIESFTTVSNLDAKNLYDDVEKYQRSSEDFIRFTMLTRNSLLKAKQQ
jgi:CRISPR/Cas system-associated endoribonuclease Cas2